MKERIEALKEWAGENKFLAVLIGVSSCVILVFGYLIYAQMGEQEELRKSITKNNADIKAFKNELGDPSKESEERLEIAVQEGLSAADELHLKLASSGSHKLNEERSSTDFATLLQKYVGENKKILSGANVKFPESSWFGFERYKETLIKPNSTAIGLCLYQQDAYNWFLKEVTSLGPCELKSFYRKSLPEEEENETEEAKDVEAVRKMRFDVELELTENQLAELLAKLAQSNNHLVIVKAMSLKNVVVAPIAITPMMNGTETGGNDNFAAAFNDEEEDNSEKEEMAKKRDLSKRVAPGDVFLEQILGEEKVIVSLAMDLVLVTDMEKLKMKKGAK